MKLQDRLKKASVKKRGERIFLEPKEIRVNPEIICTKCKKPSGFVNEDFINIKPPRDIKCKNCRKVCIELRSNVIID